MATMIATVMTGYIHSMLLSMLVAVHYPTEFNLFESTKSPSGRFAIAYRDARPGEPMPKDDDPTVNELVDLKANKVICILKGFHGFPNENHGGMDAVYNKSETVGVVMRAGKWEPRGLAFLAPGVGKYQDMRTRVQKDADFFANKGHKLAMVWDVMGAKCVGDKVLLCVAGEIPKDEKTPVMYVSLTYQVKPARNAFGVGKAKPAKLNKSQVWFWPMYK